MDFSGKTVIVTGAGGGIGEGYAKMCAARGMNVVIAELDEESGQRVYCIGGHVRDMVMERPSKDVDIVEIG